MSNPLINQDPNAHHPNKVGLKKNLGTIIGIISFIIITLVVVVIANKGARSSHQKTITDTQPNNVTGKHKSDDGTVPEKLTAQLNTTTDIKEKHPPKIVASPPRLSAMATLKPKKTLAQQRKEAYEQQIEDYRQQQLISAMGSEPRVQFKPNLAPDMQPNTTLAPKSGEQQALDAIAAQQKMVMAHMQDSPPQENAGFAKPEFVSQHTLVKPKSPYLLSVGTIIPATLINGINSDLPGQVIASVSQNVYDSVNGRYLLIPQGAKLYGVYKSDVAYGQERVLLIWQRINYPNGTTLDLDQMAGMDVQGYAGFKDQVDNHYMRIFGNALLLGTISGASQAGVSKSDDKNASTAVADGVTQQFAQTGSSLIQKNLNINPQIVIRNGYRFNVMVNKDFTLSPYQDHLPQ